jgi:hypothetical protein
VTRIDFIGFDGTRFTDKQTAAEFQERFDKWLKRSRLTSFQKTRFRPMTANGMHVLLWLITDQLEKLAPKGKQR